MNRVVLPELLDVLPPRDASAQRSRRDLRRINAWMRHPRIMARALRENPPRGVTELAELGAGDGHFLLRVAQRLHGQPPLSAATLVDRLPVLEPGIADRFARLGWRVRLETMEATDWLRGVAPGNSRVILGNLFFHQFDPEPLADMLRLAAAASRWFIALEPRRAWLPRLCGRFLWTIGCGPVTRHDARISIAAGFAGNELSNLWPDKDRWHLTERPVGLFSHLFIARLRE
jgi:hypothetical protein